MFTLGPLGTSWGPRGCQSINLIIIFNLHLCNSEIQPLFINLVHPTPSTTVQGGQKVQLLQFSIFSKNCFAWTISHLPITMSESFNQIGPATLELTYYKLPLTHPIPKLIHHLKYQSNRPTEGRAIHPKTLQRIGLVSEICVLSNANCQHQKFHHNQSTQLELVCPIIGRCTFNLYCYCHYRIQLQRNLTVNSQIRVTFARVECLLFKWQFSISPPPRFARGLDNY